MAKQRLVSIIVPIFNESMNIPLLHERLSAIAQQLDERIEFVLVDDGSHDASVTVAEQLQKKDPRIHIIELSRNFGKEAAVASGIAHARGHAAIIMDADLQHPPKLIAEFITKWKRGADIVIGIRDYDKRESWFKKFSSMVFYRLINTISHTTIIPHATDFRLIDRKVINVFNQMTERNRMNRGLIDWLGFRRDYVHFVAGLREHGQAGYTFRKLFGLAMNSFTAYSLFPLKLAGYLGICILLVSGPLNVFAITERFILGDPMQLDISGTAFVAMALLFLVGVVLACLGLVSLYIAHIHAEVTNRPLYVVRRNILSDNESEAELA